MTSCRDDILDEQAREIERLRKENARLHAERDNAVLRAAGAEARERRLAKAARTLAEAAGWLLDDARVGCVSEPGEIEHTDEARREVRRVLAMREGRS